MKYLAHNTTNTETHTFGAESDSDARHWVINHLDTSKQWTVISAQLMLCVVAGLTLNEKSHIQLHKLFTGKTHPPRREHESILEHESRIRLIVKSRAVTYLSEML